MEDRAAATRILRYLGLAVALAVFAWVLLTSDLSRAASLLSERGPALAFAIAPFGAVMLFETLAWRALFDRSARARFRDLLVVRLSTEAVLLSVPGGGLIAEALKPSLLRARADVPLAETSATVAVTKSLQPATQGVYVALSAILGASFLAHANLPLARGRSAPFLVGAVGLLLVVVGLVVGLSITKGAVAARAHALFSRIPIARLRAFLAPRAAGFEDVDRRIAEAFRDRARIAPAAAWFFLAWLFESVDSFVILRLLGADLTLIEVASFEAIVSVLRAVVVFVPAGLGVQDAGYVGFLRAFDIPNAAPLGGAFVIVKRCKELVWIGIGYALMAVQRRRRSKT